MGITQKKNTDFLTKLLYCQTSDASKLKRE